MLTGNLAVNPFDTLYIYVGGHGQSSTYGPMHGGWNGGGSGHIIIWRAWKWWRWS